TPVTPINQQQAQGQSAGAGNTPSPVTTVNTNDFYNFYGYGLRTGHYALAGKCERSLQGDIIPEKCDDNHAPELVSYLDFILGRFSNLETFTQGPNNSILKTRLYRVNLEGLLKIPATPMSIGFSANIGQIEVGRGSRVITQRAGDDLRFFFGTKFDVGKLMD